MAICFNKKCYSNRLADYLSNSIKEFFGKSEIKEQVQAVAKPYKVYSALIHHTGAMGTDDPTVTVLENTLGGDVVWRREAMGQYVGTLEGAFPRKKTTMSISPSYGNNHVAITDWSYPDEILITTTTFNDQTITYVDGALYETFVEIRVYP